MDNFFKGLKKDSASEIKIDSKLAELLNKIDCLQISEARSRQDIGEIIREELNKNSESTTQQKGFLAKG